MTLKEFQDFINAMTNDKPKIRVYPLKVGTFKGGVAVCDDEGVAWFVVPEDVQFEVWGLLQDNGVHDPQILDKVWEPVITMPSDLPRQ